MYMAGQFRANKTLLIIIWALIVIVAALMGTGYAD